MNGCRNKQVYMLIFQHSERRILALLQEMHYLCKHKNKHTSHMDLKKYYQEKLDNARHASERTKKKILHISLTRVLIFIAGFIALCIGYNQGGTFVGGILLGTFIPFLLLVKLHNRLFHQKDWYETSIRHYQAELTSL